MTMKKSLLLQTGNDIKVKPFKLWFKCEDDNPRNSILEQSGN